MVYQGSKNRIAKYIVPIIQDYIDRYNINTYIEPFCGGANMIDKVKCDAKIGCDYNDDLICLLKYAQKHPNLDIAPQDCTKEHYMDVRNDVQHIKYEQEYRALIGYMASYGGKYFNGGYGRDKTGKRNIYQERIINFKKQAIHLKDIQFECIDYNNIDISKYNNCLFYLDPPYQNTSAYSKQDIIYDDFYNFCRELSKNNIVLISEYNMPDDFECIWSKPVKCYQNSTRETASDRVEKLFVVKNGYGIR